MDEARRGASAVTVKLSLFTSSLQDVRYLEPHVRAVEKEDKERAYWDNLTVTRK